MRLLACILLSVFALLISPAGFSQSRFNPTMVILSPYSTSAPPEFSSEIQNTEMLIKQARRSREASLRGFIKDQELANIKIMWGKELDLLKHENFYTEITTISWNYLQQKLYITYFPNPMIYGVPEKAKGDLASLRAIAKKEKAQYVLNFPNVVSTKVGSAKQSTITVQLYDHKQGKILIEGEYTGGGKNPGFTNFDFRCLYDESLECTFRNALAQVLPEVVDVIVRNDPGLQREKRIKKAREEVLLNDYYLRKPDQEVARIVAAHDTSVAINTFYQGFMDPSRTKLIGFFAHYGNCNDPKVQPDTKDQGRKTGADSITNNYIDKCAYMVVGVKHEGKWYTQKLYVSSWTDNNPDLEEGRKEY